MVLKVKLMNGKIYDVDENDMINIDGETCVYNSETSTFVGYESGKETDDVVEFWEDDEHLYSIIKTVD